MFNGKKIDSFWGSLFTYDRAERPVSITGAASGSFVYDAHGRRVKQVVGGQTIYSVYSAGGTLLYRDNATTSTATDYIRMGGRAIARVRGSDVEWTYADHLGSPAAAASQTGAILWREDHTPFGEARQSPAGNADNEGFTGHIADAASGLVYMQARYYDPVVGRFLSSDPVGFAQGGAAYFNRYAYTANDPVNAVDPDGRCTGTLLGNSEVYCNSIGDDSAEESQSELTFGQAHPSLEELGLGYLNPGSESVSSDEAEALIAATGILGSGWVGRSGVSWLGRTAGGSSNIIRSASYGGTRFRINSGHGAGRTHSTGRIQSLGVSSRQAEAAMMRQIVSDRAAGGTVPVLGRDAPAIGEVAAGTGRIGYRYGLHPRTGDIVIATYYPIR